MRNSSLPGRPLWTTACAFFAVSFFALAGISELASARRPAESGGPTAENDPRPLSAADPWSARLDRLVAKYPSARRIEAGRPPGAFVALLSLSDPAVASPEQAIAQAKNGKLVVWVTAAATVNDPDPIEAILRLADEILSVSENPILKKCVVLLSPSLAGNEAAPAQTTSPLPSQGRPATTGQADYLDPQTPSVRAFLSVLREWNPSLVLLIEPSEMVVPKSVVTVAGPSRTTGNGQIVHFIRAELLRGLALPPDAIRSGFRRVAADEFAAEPAPRVLLDGPTYLSLRNIAALSLKYSPGSSTQSKVKCLDDCLLACLERACAQREKLRQTLTSSEPGRPRSQSAAKSGSVATSLARRTPPRANRERPARGPVALPYAYLFPMRFTQLTEALQQQGIEVEETREDIELDVESSRTLASRRSASPNSGPPNRVPSSAQSLTRRFAAGTAIVRTGQRLGRLVVFMLEPQPSSRFAPMGQVDAERELDMNRLPRPVPITRTAIRPLADTRRRDQPITFEQAFESDRPPNFAGSPVGGIQWLEDSRYFLQRKEGELRKVDAATGRSTPYRDKAAIGKALAALPAIGEKAAQDLANGAEANVNEARTAALLNYQNDLYYVRLDGTSAGRLTSSPQPEELARFSPDGQFVAFVRANDLFVVDIQTRTERALTRNGGERLLNGKADWVYYEEVFNRNWQAYWWSPNSRYLAFFQTDNSPVKNFTLVNDLTPDPTVERTPYPRPGEPNPRVRLAIVEVAGSTPVFADLSDYDTEGHLITGVGWWPDNSAAYCFVQDRAQTWLDVCSVPVAGGKLTRLFRDRTKAWVEAPSDLTFLKDGSFLITSERTGWQHIYHYDRTGKSLGAVTSGEWEARKIVDWDETNQWVYFTATKDNPLAENLYRAHLDGSELTRLTMEPGHHHITMSRAGDLFVDQWSNRTTPARTAVRRRDGTLLRMLDTNPVYLREEYRFGESRQFQIKTGDGFLLEAAWVKPPDFASTKKYPVWFTTYGGPHAPSISDSWGDGGLWDQTLAQAGIVVFHLDPRPASGKGAQSAWTAYRQLGVQELKDITEGIQWLKSQPWIDGRRIGMSGYSYGGFMTAYALTHSELFASGIAGAPPTDWRDYDTIYTERYMSTPQDNPEGYDSTSVVKAARNLHGQLLLVHGTIDDNVHPANTIKLAQALQEARKPFEMMFYPGFRHGIWSKHFQRQQYDFIRRTLRITSP